MTNVIRPLAAVSAAALLSSGALAGSQFQDGWRSFRDSTIQDYGYEWATVGHARNADWVGLHQGGGVVRHGGVDYRYRIARTEVTNRQWYEFVLAYAPYVSAQFSGSSQFTGTGVGLSGGGGYSLPASTADHAANVGWRFAARYVNWLHNGKVNQAWAFESGVYDTSTFGGGTQGNLALTDQRERSEGARYFLPTQDEWVKAVHFDPDRHGEGQEGYWRYPDSSDTRPVSGAPGTSGAQTNAGMGSAANYPILSYPDQQTPWGLFDASGSAYEWLETMTALLQGRRWESTSNDITTLFTDFDLISSWDGGTPDRLIGIRLASVIPAPGAGASLVALAMLMVRRRR
ncbi:MAG: SUMF1/EgtB/PvdO family nonheme iron enzyme [Phycisphaerales bacterium]|nr:SUMF1/EgtB/PvdO family nonheme iron enzyme [Phycisphaerales bacterium]